jgi:hypothetical protein
MPNEDISHASIPELISGLAGDVKEIAAGHAGHIRAEIKEELTGLKHFLMKVSIAVGLGVLGAILLAHAFALGLDAAGLPQWVAYLISAALWIGIGVVILKRFPTNKADMDLYPEESIRDIKRDVGVIKKQVTA